MNDEQIEKCRERLTEAVWDAFDSCTCGRSSHLSVCPASEYESIQTTLDQLIEFSQLVALAQQTDCYCVEWMIPLVPFRCPKHLAAAELAEIVTAVLAEAT